MFHFILFYYILFNGSTSHSLMQCDERLACCALIGYLYRQSKRSGRELTLSANWVTRTLHFPSDSRKHGAPGAIIAGEIFRIEKAEEVQHTGG